MKVRLTQKLAELMNGVDLSNAHTGDTLELSDKEAQTLIAQGWAAPVYQGGAPGRDRAHDKPRGRRAPRKKR